MNERLIKGLQGITGPNNVIFDESSLQNYSHDEFPLASIRVIPQAAVKPRDTEQISKILKLANQLKVPVTPRGGGTGLCGGCVPAKGGIVLLLDELNKIIEVDKDNLMVVAQAGVMLKDLFVRVEKEGLFFPPHPGDETAMVGGVIATNAGGARAVKHGTMRNFVRGLEVVLPAGEVISLGGKFIKNSTGFSLMNLFIGSEGTLGVITKATISLLPEPKAVATLIVPFDTINDAIGAVPVIIRERALPLAVEFIESDAIEYTEKQLERSWPVKGGKAYLLIILDADSKEGLDRLCEDIAEICMNNRARDVYIADQKTKQHDILEFRSQMYEAIKSNCIETLDIVVPRSEIPGHIETVHKIEREYGLWLPTYGHAGDGNAHIHIMKFGFKGGKPDFMVNKDWERIYPAVRALVHEDGKNRGGMVSGEHGVGLVKKEYLHDFLGDAQIGLMRSIKKAFDPNGILNPGKIF